MNNLKKISFVAQFPPPIHGLSKAVGILYHSELNTLYDMEKIDITDNRSFLSNLWKLCRSGADLFYFTISQTRRGNLRDLIILKLLRLRHKKCIIHLHGGYYRQLVDNDLPAWQRKANYSAVGRLEGVIVLGKTLEGIFEGMISPDRIYTVPNCVEEEYLLGEEEFREKLRTIEARTIKHILYLSNFISSKGYFEVLEMACLEKKRCESGRERRFHFDFAGKFFDSKAEKDFRSYIRRNGLEEYTTFHGTVTGREKKRLLQDSDIFTLLTRYPNEGQPLSILEAMGNGSVILTTDHAGIPDIVDKGNGIVADRLSTPKQLYEVLESLKTEDFRKMEMKGRERVMKYHRQEAYINNMKNILGGGNKEEHTGTRVTYGIVTICGTGRQVPVYG